LHYFNKTKTLTDMRTCIPLIRANVLSLSCFDASFKKKKTIIISWNRMATVVFAGCTGGMGSILFRKVNDNATTFLSQPIRHLICVDYFRDEAAQRALKASCSPSIPRVDTFHWDASVLSSTKTVTEQIEAAIGQHGSVHHVILTTGMGFHGRLEDMDVEGSHKILNKLLHVNAVGPSLLLQYCAKRMPAASTKSTSTAPTMLVLSSYSGLIGLPHRAAYCASKFALNGYLEGIAAEYPAIRYVLICPTSVATNFRDNWKKQLGASDSKQPPAVEVNEAQLTVDQCVDGIWRALTKPSRQSAGVHYVILPGGKTEVAYVGVRMPWGIGNMVRQRVYRQASAKL
jgi:NAD(P)-dependent dehydrogenase (short-subunit alcohol dehydrogenase family)